MKVSEYYGLDMYSDKGNRIGEVEEVMLDTEKGEIAGLVFDKSGGKYTAVPYGSVAAVGEVIIARTGQRGPVETETGEEEVGVEETGEEMGEMGGLGEAGEKG